MTLLPAFAVHRLSSAEIGLMRRLNAMFGDVFDDPETYEASPPSDRYLARLLGDEAFVVLAALEGERVIGGLVAYVLRKFERERSEAYIYDLAVVSDRRRRGVATALVQALFPIAAALGAWVVFVQADVGDAPAIAFYSRLGSGEDVLHFDIAPPRQGIP